MAHLVDGVSAPSDSKKEITSAEYFCDVFVPTAEDRAKTARSSDKIGAAIKRVTDSVYQSYLASRGHRWKPGTMVPKSFVEEYSERIKEKLTKELRLLRTPRELHPTSILVENQFLLQ